MGNTHEIDTLMGFLEDFGKYQRWQFVLHLLAALTSGINMFSSIFINAVPDHRCLIPQVDYNSIISNETLHLERFIPAVETGRLDSCAIYEFNNITNITIVSQCSAWKYDTTYHSSSRGMEWNFVCSRKWMGAVAKSAYMFGVIIGAAVLGRVSDRFGRKPVLCISGFLQLLIGIAIAFIPEYYTYLVITVLYGLFGSAGGQLTAYVLTIELVGTAKRTACSLAFQITFTTGMMVVAGWGVLIADRQLLQVVYGLHAVLLIGHWWLIDESPRWLWAKGRTIEAMEIIRKAMKINGSTIELDPSEHPLNIEWNVQKDKTNIGLVNLFKTQNLRKRTINICMCFFSIAMVYYFQSFGIGGFHGNPFLIFFILSAVEIPGFIITIILIPKIGRRGLMSFDMIIGGILCIVARYLNTGSAASICVLVLSKFSIASSYAIVYNYSAELFPTVIRNSAVGLGAMCSKIGGVAMPLISLLDTFNPTLPTIFFSVVIVTSGFFVLFLPETVSSSLPETIEDGENFGAGDTCFTTCLKNRRGKHVISKSEIENLTVE